MGVAERKEREFKRREQEILEAALDLFGRDDWQSVTIEQIAQAAEIGKGTVYKHFESKDQIYARLALGYHRRNAAELQSIDPRLDPLQRVRLIVRTYFRNAALASKEMRRVLQYTQRDDFLRTLPLETRREWLALNDEMFETIDRTMGDGRKAGYFPADPRLLFGAQAAINGAIQMVWGGCTEGTDPEPLLESLTRFVLAGLRYQDRAES
ncbi:TetR/AcrR family transcriptional regulator [Vulgatibacter sp.]|uniref:TetR/AcrR family transcriptional regulator n=1 Tax=Vulgatibacter sp. TaxID=1971226 RepID=UPI0035629A68